MDRARDRLQRCVAPTLVFLVAATVLAFGAAGFWPWISDDAFISLRYAERLWQGHGLTWTDGEHVEGYSNLLWVLLSCAGHAIGCDWITTVRGLGIGTTIATFAALTFLRWPMAGRSPRGSVVQDLTAHVPVLVLAMLPPTSLWAIGGLETPLALLLTTTGFAATGAVLAARHREHEQPAGAVPPRNTAIVAGVSFALLAWTRPDGPLAGCLAAAIVWLAGPAPRLRLAGWVAGPMLAAIAIQVTFRLIYYGDYVPNTAHAKVGTSAGTIALGLDYLQSSANVLFALLVPATVGLVLALTQRSTRAFAGLVAAFLGLWAIYTTSVGGDLFPLCRLMLPALGPLTLLALLGFARLTRSSVGTGFALLLGAGSLTAAFVGRNLDPEDPYQQVSDWEWRGEATGRWLGDVFGNERPLLALDAAGGVPFFSRLPCLDMLGLNDRHIATAPLPDPEHVVPGHSRGDGRYVLDREPDLVLFASPTGDPSPRWPGSWQMERDPRFLRRYRAVVGRTGTVRVRGAGEHDLKLTLWVRLTGKVGLRETADGFVVPGWVLGAHRQPRPFHLRERQPPEFGPEERVQVAVAAQAMLTWWNREAVVAVREAPNTPAAEFRRPGTAVLEDLPLPAGDYEILVEPPDAAIDLQLVPTTVPGSTGRDLRATVRQNADLPQRIRQVRLVRR